MTRGKMTETGPFLMNIRFIKAVLVVIVTSLQSPVRVAATEGTEAEPFEHFITRRDEKLYDGEKVFRFIGANMPGLILPYDFTLRWSDRMTMPTAWEQEDAFKTLVQMNFKVVRTWNLPIRGPDEPVQPWHYVLGPGEFNESAFQVLDRALALANRYGVRLIVPLTAEAGDLLGGIGTYAAHRGKPRAAFYTDPQLREDYKATLQYVLNRVNSVTGQRYCEDKAVLAWQFGNEMFSAPDEWLAEMGACLKSLSKHQLVSETRHRPANPMYVDANIDLVTRHLYTNYPGVEAGWPAAMKQQLATLPEPRPLFIGEFGPYIDNRMLTWDNLVEKTRDLMDLVESEPAISGALLWSMYFHREAGGFYWHQVMTYPSVWSYHWPGFLSATAQREEELLKLLRETAYRLDGMSPPPLPVPEAPKLLPFEAVPLFSWRGSAGARGYDIERAPRAEGPWVTLAENVPDADVAYRPLYSDVSAKAGDAWFYRVVARNESGCSLPSNVIGPVQVNRVCFVDELSDFSRTHGHSETLSLNNDFNGRFAEYLFRAKGGAADWLAYQMPAAIDEVKVVAFHPGGQDAGEGLVVESSSDGKVFQVAATSSRAQSLPGPPAGPAKGKKSTMVEYQVKPAGRQRYLRIRWQGEAELDRVEVYHTGEP